MKTSTSKKPSTQEKSAVTPKADFHIRDVSSAVLKSLTPNECNLWITLLRLADAKTGALCINGDWLTAERIQREAGIGRIYRRQGLRGLVAKGLVKIEQSHSVQEIDGRKRSVFKNVQYWVSKKPRQDWVSSARQSEKPHKQRVSSARQSSARQFFCKHTDDPINSSHKAPFAAGGVDSVSEESVLAPAVRLTPQGSPERQNRERHGPESTAPVEREIQKPWTIAELRRFQEDFAAKYGRAPNIELAEMVPPLLLIHDGVTFTYHAFVISHGSAALAIKGMREGWLQ